jgi:hypothetical protein
MRLSFSIRFRLIQAGQAHESLASIAPLSVALQQLVLSKHCQCTSNLDVVGTVADVTDVHVFKGWGEVWRFKP